MRVLLLLVLAALPASLLAQPADYPALKAKAEAFFADRSFSKAREVYQQAKALPLSAADARWVNFRLADTLWRSQAATQTSDDTQFENARRELEALVRDLPTDARDRVWAETEESLGDFFWTRRWSHNWGSAWPYYQNALDWWAGSTDLDLARDRYLHIVWTIARPPLYDGEYYYYGNYGNVLPTDIIENALKIARTDNDRAHAHYLMAMTLQRNGGGDWSAQQRVPEEFEAALKSGKSTDWYDDALYQYAIWLESPGRTVRVPGGGWNWEPDFVKSLELFRRLVREFSKGETRYWEEAQQRIREITDPQVQVGVSSAFLPGSEMQYYLNWRNVKHIDLALYRVDLSRDVQMEGDDAGRDNWIEDINLPAMERVKSWSHDTGDKGDYRPGNATLRLDDKLPPGAYVIEAEGGGKSPRDLLLVSDATLVIKTSGRQALVYFCNALDGSPLNGGTVHLWERYYNDNHWHWRDTTKTTGADGIAVFDLAQAAANEQIFAGAVLKDRQAFAFENSYYYTRERQPWKIYACTDRPAYRPKETVQWKFIARRNDGSVYSTPADQTIEFEIHDPRGAKVKEDKVKLNAFGSVWGSLDLTEAMPLGEYQVTFWDEGRHAVIGSATLFRLEEYKLPEFKVNVETPAENGRKKAFRVGETVNVNIQSDYYFGGPVANATVEVLVYQNPFYHFYRRPHEFEWYYDDDQASGWAGRRRWYGGEGQIVKRETLKTDASGRASLSFDTPRDNGQEYEYRIEARVTDASRREITGNGTVRVTRQRYYVYPDAEHNLYAPQDKVEVKFKAQDANDQPVQTEGTVKVTRDTWFEVWLDPDGREVKGEALRRLRAGPAIFPPPPKPGRQPWQLKLEGYDHEDILTRTLKTDTNGEAQLTFTPEHEGFYRVSWSSEDTDTNAAPTAPIQAETTVWVTTRDATELGYHTGGVEIVVDKDTFRVGQKAPIMLTVPTNDRYVLFSVEGADLYNYQLVHVTGTTKLIELPIEEKHVPNIFLSAALVSDRQLSVDTKQVVVPPTKNFISVDVKPDRAQYQPQEKGTFTITTLDDNQHPTPAEVSFGLVDESVYYIQSDYAGDPRQFYYGEKRSQQVQTASTFNQKSYARLVEDENKNLIDVRDLEFRLQQKLQRNRAGFGGGGGGGGELAADGVTLDDREKDVTKRISTVNAVSGTAVFAAAKMPMLGALRRAAKEDENGRLEMPAAMPATPPGVGGTIPEQEPAVQVRSDFRSTVLWKPDVITGADGKATLEVKYPDSLTSWKATARAVSTANQFGIATATTRTKQPLIVRLEAPRFFVVGDTVTISAVVNNNTDSEMTVRPTLEPAGVFSGIRLEPAASLKVPANGEARADWVLPVSRPGEAKLKVVARGAKYADAMEKSYTVYEHGIEKFVSKSGKVRGDDITVNLELPAERKKESTSLVVQITPSMAVTMLDALPYLINYPYGCTEQTMSRFLPTAITAKTLKDLGLKPGEVMGRVFGGIEPASAAATHPQGRHDLQREMDDMINRSLDRLYDFQHSDGGWGWWKEGGSDHFMTAYVVWGLTLARDAGIDIKQHALDRGMDYLDKRLVEEESSYDEQAWMLHALSAADASLKRSRSKFESKAFDNLWTNRDQLNAYTRALLALCAHQYGLADQARTLVENLENGVKIDNTPDHSVLINNSSPSTAIATAHWGEDGIYWRWSDGGIEATAFALRALLAIDPTNKLVEPVSNWLVKNRRGAQWSNTRDTAITVLALNDYLRASGELSPDLEYELSVNGQSIAHKKVSGADVFNAPSQFTVDAKLIRDGSNEIHILRRGGKGPIYFAANATFFSLEEPITPAGNEIFVRRQYYKLAGRPTLLKGYGYDREPLNDGDSLKSGERVETLLTIESKNNYEYLLFEDLKPAGFEAVEVRSGESLYARELKSGAVDRKFGTGSNQPATDSGDKSKNSARTRVRPRPVPSSGDDDYTGRSQWVYQELRDRKVALFIDKLPQGVWQIKYDLRAEVPGQFHALPVVGHAMYVPEIRCNGAEVRVKVEDAR